MTERYTTTDGGAPGTQRRAIADCRAGRSNPAAGSLLDRADGAVQPGAHPGTSTARQGRRRLRPLRGDQRRQQVHQGRGLPAGHQDRHADPVLHRGWRARQPRHLARPARVLAEVLHVGGQLRHGRQQHAGVLHARPDEVPALHPIPEAHAGNQPARPQHAVGLLEPDARIRTSGDLADGGSRYPQELAAHERLQQPHLQLDQCRRRDLLGEVPLHQRSGHRLPNPGGRRPDRRRRRRLPPARPLRRRSRAATSRAGR